MRSFAFLFALSSFSALACPNLAGKYARCASSTGVSAESSDVVVTQTLQGGATVYTITETNDDSQERSSTHFRADGRTYTTSERDPDMGWVMVTKTTVRCSGQKLLVHTTANLEGEQIATINGELTKQGKQIRYQLRGKMMGQDLEDLIICE